MLQNCVRHWPWAWRVATAGRWVRISLDTGDEVGKQAQAATATARRRIRPSHPGNGIDDAEVSFFFLNKTLSAALLALAAVSPLN